MNIVTTVNDYIKTSRQELKKVVWPTRQQTIQHTALVIAISLGVAAFLGLADFILTQALSLVLK